MATVQGPPVGDYSANDFFRGFGGMLLDVGRAKLIDVERPEDDNNIPDYADIKTGQVYRRDASGGNFAQVFTEASPLQVGGLVLATGLTIALVAGAFSGNS